MDMISPDLSPQHREVIEHLRKTGEIARDLIEQGLEAAKKLPEFTLNEEGSEFGFKTITGSYTFINQGRPSGRIWYEKKYLNPGLGSENFSIVRITDRPDGTATITEAYSHTNEGYYNNPKYGIDFPIGSFHFTESSVIEKPGDRVEDNEKAKQRIISQIQSLGS